MSNVLNSQLDAIEAQLEVLKVMVTAVRHTMNAPRAKEAPLPEGCEQEQPEYCARQNPDAAIEMGGMGGGPVTVMCRGCGKQEHR